MRNYKITYDENRVTIIAAPTADNARDRLRKIFPHARITKTEITKIK